MIEMQYVWIRNYESPRTIVAHQHACYEFIYYLKGDGEGVNGKTKYRYEPGTFVLVEPDTIHGEVHNTQTSMISIGFCLHDYFISPQNCCYKDDTSKIFELVQAIRHEFKGKPPYYREYIENLLGNILIHILRKGPVPSPGKENSIRTKTKRFWVLINFQTADTKIIQPFHTAPPEIPYKEKRTAKTGRDETVPNRNRCTFRHFYSAG